jgi:hypothetical protein
VLYKIREVFVSLRLIRANPEASEVISFGTKGSFVKQRRYIKHRSGFNALRPIVVGKTG